MGIFGRRHERDVVHERDAADERWASPPIVRGVMTLIGVGAAGFLIWLATLFELDTTGEFWAAMGLLAAAGIEGFVQDMSLFQGAIAFAIGLVFSFVFDTAGPRRIVQRERDVVPDEDVHDYERRDVTTPTGRTVVREDEDVVPAGEVRSDRVEIHHPERRDIRYPGPFQPG